MKNHRFICLKFKNTSALNKIKNFWYDITADPTIWTPLRDPSPTDPTTFNDKA